MHTAFRGLAAMGAQACLRLGWRTCIVVCGSTHDLANGDIFYHVRIRVMYQ